MAEFPTQQAHGRPRRIVHCVKMHLPHGGAPVIVGDGLLLARHMGADEGGREEPARRVVQRLPPAGKLERTPRGDGPAVVELPVQRAHATRHAAPTPTRMHSAWLSCDRKISASWSFGKRYWRET